MNKLLLSLLIMSSFSLIAMQTEEQKGYLGQLPTDIKIELIKHLLHQARLDAQEQYRPFSVYEAMKFIDKQLEIPAYANLKNDIDFNKKLIKTLARELNYFNLSEVVRYIDAPITETPEFQEWLKKQQRLLKYEMQLIDASREGNKEKVKELLTHDIDLNTERFEQIALINAAEKNHVEIVDLLLRRGANSNIQDNIGSTPLLAGANNPQIVRLLLAAGANPNIYNYNKLSPLLLAVKRNNIESVKLLLDAGANPNPEPDALPHETPLSVAEKNGFTNIVTLLKQAGAKSEESVSKRKK
jgi:ankyrin repeat protein